MIVDSSAILSIVFREPEAQAFLRLLEADEASISSANWFEGTLRVDRLDSVFIDRYDQIFKTLEISVAPVDFEQAELAREAYRTYGKGNHPAGLNFGDCFAYALSKSTGRPLLFKGDDFSKTDIIPAHQRR